ncbi:MAG: hypothetical protein U1F53_23155 [Burkholderiaceae bacterium]
MNIFNRPLGLLTAFMVSLPAASYAAAASVSLPTAELAPSDLPVVIDLVKQAESRVSRTVYDYTFRPVVKGGAIAFSGGTFRVAATAVGTTIQTPSLVVGQLDAARMQVLQNTVVIRQDRAYPFQKSGVKFEFVPAEQQVAIPAPGALAIGTPQFMESGGRPGHEGQFAIEDSAPRAGKEYLLSVPIQGSVASATFRLLDRGNSTLAAGELKKLWTAMPEMSALVAIPTVPFSIAVVATSAQESASHKSNIYTPSAFKLSASFKNGAFSYGQIIKGNLTAKGLPAGERVQVQLSLPDGFTAVPSSATLSGDKPSVDVQISSPASGRSPYFHQFNISYALVSSPANLQIMSLNFFAR